MTALLEGRSRFFYKVFSLSNETFRVTLFSHF